MSDECQRFFEACVSSFTGFEQSPKLLRRYSAVNLSLQWRAPCGCVHHTLNMNSSHFPADTGHAKRQKIHHKSGIHTGPDDSRTTFFANPIEFRGQPRLTKLWKEQLFAR